MSTSMILELEKSGVHLSLSSTGELKAKGSTDAIKKSLPLIREHKAALITELRNAGKSWRWLINFTGRDPMTVTFSPEASRAEVLEQYPEAVAAEPVPDSPKAESSGLLTPEQETAILAWLAFIGENDIVTLGEVIEACRRDADARAYFLGRASERLVGDGKAD
jgi:hypothetical protein